MRLCMKYLKFSFSLGKYIIPFVVVTYFSHVIFHHFPVNPDTLAKFCIKINNTICHFINDKLHVLFPRTLTKERL